MIGFSQNNTLSKLVEIGDSVAQYRLREITEIARDSAKEKYFSIGAYDRFFDKYFTQIKYERETFTEGNSASLKIQDNKTRLNLTLSKKAKNSIFSVGTSLNISDNSGVIFSGDRPTTGTELFGSFSFLIPGLRHLGFDGEQQDNNYRKRRAFLDSMWFVHSKKNPAYGNLLLNKLRIQDSLFKRYDSIVQNPGTLDVLRYKDSLVSVIDAKLKTSKELEGLDNGEMTAADLAEEIKKAAEKSVIEKELSTNGVTSFRMSWFTTGLLYRRDNYATYDSLLNFSKRVNEKAFDKWLVNITYNFFWQRTDSWIAFRNSKFINSIYLNANYSLIRSNSYENLSEMSFSTTRTRLQNDTTYEFSTSKKLRDISGTEFTTRWVHRMGIVTTAMLGKKQFFGLNLSGTTDMSKAKKPVLATRLGLLFRFKDSENEKSLVNFELFLSLNDLTDTRQKNKTAWQRKEIGVSATVPFQKVFFR